METVFNDDRVEITNETPTGVFLKQVIQQLVDEAERAGEFTMGVLVVPIVGPDGKNMRVVLGVQMLQVIPEDSGENDGEDADEIDPILR